MRTLTYYNPNWHPMKNYPINDAHLQNDVAEQP